MERVAVGLGVRDVIADELLLLPRGALDLLEVMIDDGLEDGPRRAVWRRLGAKWPLIAHGTELGVGDAAGLDAAYVARVGAALTSIHARWYSEHCSFLRAGGVELGHFAPLGGDSSTVDIIAANAAAVRGRVSCPFLLENPADVLGLFAEEGNAGASLGRAFHRTVTAADAGVLLDLTNLVLDARNHGFEASAFLHELPWERIVEVHLAGGHREGAVWIDSHAFDVDAEALELLHDVARKAPNLRGVIVERDDRIPSLDRLVGEVDRARAILGKTGRA